MSLSVLLMCLIICQVTVNGVVPGKTWRAPGSGKAQCMSAWGRTAIVDIKSVWVNIDGDDLTIGCDFDQPILDGSQRKSYFFPRISSKLSNEFPERIQVITEREITGISDDESMDFHTVRTAVVTFDKSGKPTSLSYSEVTHAEFDVKAAIAKFSRGGEMDRRQVEDLVTFDSNGFRRLSFAGVLK